MKLERDDMCFGCGKQNNCGLQLEIEYENGFARSKVVFKDHHQGWKGIVHGGVIAAALDEIMAYAVGSKGIPYGVTAEMRVRFKKPVLVGREYQLEAEVIEFHSRKAVIRALLRSDGSVHAEAEGIYVLLKEVRF